MEKEISYQLKRSRRAKRIRLTVHCDGRVVVTTPFGIEPSIVEKFFADKKDWVWKKVQFFKNVDRKVVRIFSDHTQFSWTNLIMVS